MFYQSFMGWINYYIKQYSVSLIMHTSVPYPHVLEHFPDSMNHMGWLYFDTVICLLQSPLVLYFCVLSGKLFYFSLPSSLISHLPPPRTSQFIWFGIWCLFHEDRTRMCFSSTAPDICLQVNSSCREPFPFMRGSHVAFIRSNDFACALNYINTVLAYILYSTSTLYFCVMLCFHNWGQTHTHAQPTQSAERPLYLKNHTYPVVPFNTY